MDSRFQELDSSLCQWNLDSRFQSLVGFRIPLAVFRIPMPRLFDFTRQKITWGEVMDGTHQLDKSSCKGNSTIKRDYLAISYLPIPKFSLQQKFSKIALVIFKITGLAGQF